MNPVVRKDLLSLLRLRRTVAIQLAFIASLAVLVLVTWPQGALGWNADDNLLLGLIVGQIVLLILFVPGIASVAITGEKEANTLEMLYASRLTAVQIVVGKLTSALSFPMLLLICGLPFLGLLGYRGHLNGSELALSCAILVTTAVLLAVLSLAISALCRQSATALVISYLAVLGLCGATLVPAQLMLETASGLKGEILHYVQSLSPVAAALSVLQKSFRPPEGLHVPQSWQVFLPAAWVMIAGCLAIVTRSLGRPPSSMENLGSGAADEHRSLARRVLVLIDTRKQRRPLGHFNPMLGKERRTSNLRSGRWSIRIFYASLGLSLVLAFMSLTGGVEHADLLGRVAQVIVAFQLGLVGLVTPSLTSSAISGELESANWEALRLTRLGAWRIFWGKLLPALLPALLPLVALAPAYAVVAYINPDYIVYLVRVLPVAGVAVVFCCVLGLTCSSFISSTARATVVSYLITAGLFVLPMMGWWAAGTQLDQLMARWLCLPSPLVMALAQLPAAKNAYPSLFELWPQHLAMIGGLCVVMLALSWVRLNRLMRIG